MSESSSDTESSCGWTIISNEGSDIETLGPETGIEPSERAPVPDQTASLGAEGDVDVGESSIDVTLKEETLENVESSPEAVKAVDEHVTLCSSSDHSDIVTLEDSRDQGLGPWEEPSVKEDDDDEARDEELYLGTSSSSQYTFSAPETAVFPVDQPASRDSSSSSSDETEREQSPVPRRRRVRKSTAGSEPEETQQQQQQQQHLPNPREQQEQEVDEVAEQQEHGAAPPSPPQGQISGALNKCILLALVIAISTGFGHFYGTIQIQERQRMVEKSRLMEPHEMREFQQCQRAPAVVSKEVIEKGLREDQVEKHEMLHSLSGIVDKITKENQQLRLKQAELQAERKDLFERLKQTKSEMNSRQQQLTMENQQLKNSLEREEASLSALQEELRHLRAQIRELEEKGAGTDLIRSENQKLKNVLQEERQRSRSFLSQREALMAEAQVLRKELDKERQVTDRLKEELNNRDRSGADPETEQLQTRLQELEKKLSFEQQRSDLWERLYVESKEERSKGDRHPKSKRPKESMIGKVKETFDAVKNSTKEFVHHHKEQIKKAKEAVKENLRKFSDSVKSTFRHFKDSASHVFGKGRQPQERKFHERKDPKPEQQDHHQERFKQPRDKKADDASWHSHRPLHQHPRKSTTDSFHQAGGRGTHRFSDTRKDQRGIPKGCSGVFDCAYQESMSLFNKAMDPIRADEFNQLLQSYLQQSVGHFHHWTELENFINNFFHNGVFIHDQMLFTDFVSGVEDYLEDMEEYQSHADDVFEDLDDFIYRHFFGETYSKRYGPRSETQ
ncbi:cell cycle progression protein 1 isoform X2 [Chanos chanos]|uniref:Cell cycle progression protein 1 isoform X2 n=1 Tax=Chanos chanos TaxID=29144 RepID=A0A6J2URK6_CHACN|nr:cell cycle progression protein 1 isoform X2 [Chanos chanos]